MSADPEIIAEVERKYPSDKYKHNSPSLPILFNDGALQVYKNHCNELFVEDVRTGVSIRINSVRDRGLEFTTDGDVRPTIVNGHMIGWQISYRR